MNGYLLAGALLGLTLLGIGAPMVMTMAQFNGPTPWYMHEAEQGPHHGPYVNDHAPHQCPECPGTCNQTRIHEQDRIHDRIRECCDKANMTTITGTIIEVNAEEGILILTTGNGNITVMYRGIWTDGSTEIPYYKLITSSNVGEEITITGFNKCCDGTLRALKITINNTTYELAMWHHS